MATVGPPVLDRLDKYNRLRLIELRECSCKTFQDLLLHIKSILSILNELHQIVQLKEFPQHQNQQKNTFLNSLDVESKNYNDKTHRKSKTTKRKANNRSLSQDTTLITATLDADLQSRIRSLSASSTTSVTSLNEEDANDQDETDASVSIPTKSSKQKISQKMSQKMSRRSVSAGCDVQTLNNTLNKDTVPEVLPVKVIQPTTENKDLNEINQIVKTILFLENLVVKIENMGLDTDNAFVRLLSLGIEVRRKRKMREKIRDEKIRDEKHRSVNKNKEEEILKGEELRLTVRWKEVVLRGLAVMGQVYQTRKAWLVEMDTATKSLLVEIYFYNLIPRLKLYENIKYDNINIIDTPPVVDKFYNQKITKTNSLSIDEMEEKEYELRKKISRPLEMKPIHIAAPQVVDLFTPPVATTKDDEATDCNCRCNACTQNGIELTCSPSNPNCCKKNPGTNNNNDNDTESNGNNSTDEDDDGNENRQNAGSRTTRGSSLSSVLSVTIKDATQATQLLTKEKMLSTQLSYWLFKSNATHGNAAVEHTMDTDTMNNDSDLMQQQQSAQVATHPKSKYGSGFNLEFVRDMQTNTSSSSSTTTTTSNMSSTTKDASNTSNTSNTSNISNVTSSTTDNAKNENSQEELEQTISTIMSSHSYISLSNNKWLMQRRWGLPRGFSGICIPIQAHLPSTVIAHSLSSLEFLDALETMSIKAIRHANQLSATHVEEKERR